MSGFLDDQSRAAIEAERDRVFTTTVHVLDNDPTRDTGGESDSWSITSTHRCNVRKPSSHRANLEVEGQQVQAVVDWEVLFPPDVALPPAQRLRFNGQDVTIHSTDYGRPGAIIQIVRCGNVKQAG